MLGLQACTHNNYLCCNNVLFRIIDRKNTQIGYKKNNRNETTRKLAIQKYILEKYMQNNLSN